MMNSSTRPIENESAPVSISRIAEPPNVPLVSVEPQGPVGSEVAGAPALKFRTAAEIALDSSPVKWLLRPFLERNSMCLMFGELGTLKSFLALDWALRIASGLAVPGGISSDPLPVIYLSAEGRGLGKRIRGWSKQNLGGLDGLNGIRFYAIERPVNLSARDVVDQIVAAINHTGIIPALIVNDTVSRNSNGRVEASTEDATEYMNTIDSELRARYGACILFVHHVGHKEQHRARGPYVFMANTDANFLVERLKNAELKIRITCGRLKDCESPAPLELQGMVVDLGDVDEFGVAVTTLVLVPGGDAKPGVSRRPTGKKQLLLLEALERRLRQPDTDPVISTAEIASIGLELSIHRNTLREAKNALEDQQFLVPTAGGYRLNDK